MTPYKRMTRDQRLGYAALIVGACAFVTLLIGQGFILDQIRDKLP
ncbi:MAG: hypothetical protein JWM79_3122, partial [Nocardioides sp.]|nr:hypothetical protein [Nocardioides sp.]